MSLKQKTLLIAGSAFIFLFLIGLALARTLLLESYSRLEESMVRQNVGRVLNAISDDMANLTSVAKDWSTWDDTYNFIEDRNDDYIRSNLLDETFIGLHLNVMVFVNSSGKIVYEEAFDLINNETAPVPPSLLEHLSDNSPLLQHLDSNGGKTGILMLPEGPLLLASQPILTSEDEGSICGTLIMGHYLDNDQVERLSERTDLAVDMISINTPGISTEVQEIRTTRPEEKNIQVKTINENEIAGYGVLEDIYGQPALVLKVDMTREIYRQGLNSILLFGEALLVAGLALGATSMIILNKLVLSRVPSLGGNVKGIGIKGSRSGRVQVSGNDEISHLATEINGMLEALERAEKALKQSEERSRAIVENQNDLVCQWLPDGTLIFVNEAYCRYLGKSREELIGHSFLPLIYQEDREKVLEYIATFGQDRTDGTIEHRVIILDGELRWRQWRDQMIYDEKNERFEFLSIGRDITEIKRAEFELRGRLEFERLITNLSASFINLPLANMDEQINQVLQRIGEFAGVDRSYVFLFSQNGLVMDNTHEWCAGGVEPQIHNLKGLSVEDFSWWTEKLKRFEIIHIPNVGELPVEANAEREILQAQGIQSVVVVPLVCAEILLGYLGFDAVNNLNAWSEEDITLLRIVGDILGNAIAHIRDQQELKTRERYLVKLNEITVAAINSRNVEEMLDLVANRINELINADGCYITLWDEQREEVIPAAASEPYSQQYRNLLIEPGEVTMSASVLKAGHVLIAEEVHNSPFISPRIANLFSTRSLLGVPLIADGRKLGVVLLAYNQTHHFSSEEISLSQQAASQIALALMKMASLDEAQKHAQEAETLRRAGTIVATALEPEVAIERILDQLERVVPFDSASVQLLGEGYLEIQAGRGWPDHRSVVGLRFPVPGENPNTFVIQQRQPYLIDDVQKVFTTFQQAPHSHIRSWLGVPLIVHDQVIGMLALDNKQPNFYQSSHVKLASAFADQVAISLENARLYATEHRRALELDALRATVADITSELELPNLLRAVVERAATLLNATGGELGLYDESRKDIQIVVSQEMGANYSGVRMALGEDLIGYVAETSQTVVIEDYTKWEGRSKKFDSAAIHAAIATPLMIGERLLGVIVIVSSDLDRQFTPTDQRLLNLFAQQAAVAVENARLFDELERQASTDILTGLYNRRGLFEMGQRELDRALRYDRPLSAIMLDIDLFKQVNDKYSHAIGDQVLQGLAEILLWNLRGIDILGRYGGEEFAILLPETEIQYAYQVAERLRESVAKTPFNTETGKLNITISLGVSCTTGKKIELAALLDQADIAMYAAKQKGRNRVCIFEGSQHYQTRGDQRNDEHDPDYLGLSGQKIL